MDRFKFRAWHIEQKRMIELYGLGHDFATENTLDGIDPGNNAFMGDDFEKLTVMQCTGLKDKNGTLIFEGDIISHPRNSRTNSGNGKTKLVNCVVSWNKGYCKADVDLNPEMKSNPFWFNTNPGFIGTPINSELKESSWGYDWSEFHDCEVIGNIHQNHELL